MKIDITSRSKVKVKRSSAGLGLFADQDISKGTCIIEYVGPYLTNKEVEERGGRYLFEVSKTRTIDGSARSNIARYANHFCKPNAQIEIVKGRVYIIAKTTIKKGEEIGYDYGPEYFEGFIKQYGCKCGAEKHLYIQKKKGNA